MTRIPTNDREMQALIRKLKKHHKTKSVDTNERPTHYVDRDAERDTLLADASADEIFREMKRRDF